MRFSLFCGQPSFMHLNQKQTLIEITLFFFYQNLYYTKKNYRIFPLITLISSKINNQLLIFILHQSLILTN